MVGPRGVGEALQYLHESYQYHTVSKILEPGPLQSLLNGKV